MQNEVQRSVQGLQQTQDKPQSDSLGQLSGWMTFSKIRKMCLVGNVASLFLDLLQCLQNHVFLSWFLS